MVAHNLTSEQRDETRAILKRLPSRKRQKRHYDEAPEESAGHTDSSDSFLNRELEKRRLHKLKVRRKFRLEFCLYLAIELNYVLFRAVVRVIMILDKFLRGGGFKAGRGSSAASKSKNKCCIS